MDNYELLLLLTRAAEESAESFFLKDGPLAMRVGALQIRRDTLGLEWHKTLERFLDAILSNTAFASIDDLAEFISTSLQGEVSYSRELCAEFLAQPRPSAIQARELLERMTFVLETCFVNRETAIEVARAIAQVEGVRLRRWGV